MRFVLAFVTIAALGTAARADTIIAGGNLSTQTWTLANSPYTLQGDVTVIAGATLTIEAGVVVQAVSDSDAQGAGRDSTLVELTVNGSLVVNGTSANPVTFKSTSTTSGTWYGIVAPSSAAQVKIDHANIQHAVYGITSEATGTVLQATNVSVVAAQYHGFLLSAGSPTLDTVSAISSGNYGVYVTGTADPTLVRCVIRNSSYGGVYIVPGAPGHSVNITNCTLNANGSYGVYAGGSTANGATVTIVSTILTNSSYGVYRAQGSVLVTYSNAWNNSSKNFQNMMEGAGTISANPLYVSTTDLRLTSNSPSRYGANGGGDQGALPYDGVATPGLYGVLWSNTTLTAAVGTYTAAGDVTVGPNVTLTIEPGVTLSFTGDNDIMKAGSEPGFGELIVRGTLVASGTATNPITFKSTSTSSGSWKGIVVPAGAVQAKIEYANIQHAMYGVTNQAAGTVLQATNVAVVAAQYHGFLLEAGSPTLDTVSAISSGNYGVYVTGTADPTLVRCVIRNSSYGGVYIVPGAPGHSVNITNCTLNANGSYGVYAGGSTANGATVTIVSTILTNSSYGVYRAQGSVSVTYSNAWNNSSKNFQNMMEGAGTISANPLYVSTTDLRLTSNSPSRYGGPSNEDQGALPYDTVATPGLYGTLWTNTTLTAAAGPYTAAGDLTIPPNVTLTIEPGATLRFTGDSDIMKAGTQAGFGELIVRGTLVADGSPQNPITLSSTLSSAGSWWGVDLDTTAASTVLDNVIIRHPMYGFSYASTGSGNVLKRIAVESAQYYGAWLRAGSPTIDSLTAIGTGNYGVYMNESASATLTNCVVRNSSYGGIYIVPNTPGRAVTITNCTLNANGSYGVYSGGSSGNGATVTVTNSILTNSSYGVYRSQGSVTVTYSNAWNNSSNNYQNLTPGTGAISANPQYVSSTDLRLMSTSVAIDAGTTGPANDALGVARPLDGNGIGGAQYDMGAYEFVLTVACGNGVTETGETCDDGNNNGMYGHCNASCNGMGPRCGDSVMNGPEQCDDGNQSNNDECLNTCMNPTCGDGYVRMNVEACDDGNQSNTDACLNTCAAASCGDGHVRAGMEACDDGNTSNEDACLATCEVATCGDGYTQAGVEDCDDGNTSNEDACLNVCASASCGDGFVHMGAEGCDDGNMIDTDECSSTCVPSTCGNGVVEGDWEMCDDGNDIESDACRSNCLEARCGDGAIYGGVEECDDGNTEPGDGCDELCIVEGKMPGGGEMPSDGGGCCETSRGAGPSSLLLALAVMFGMRRRRRR